MDPQRAQEVLDELYADEEFGRTVNASRESASRVAEYLERRGFNRVEALLFAMAYAAGASHTLTWAGRLVDRVTQ